MGFMMFPGIGPGSLISKSPKAEAENPKCMCGHSKDIHTLGTGILGHGCGVLGCLCEYFVKE